ncbi:MAG: hypothetical protein L0215_23060 [Gemmataceae bacterium]|nr:hypothetical protein [Gemmataceae bacterium]
MTNNLGKGLVLAHAAFSLLALAGAIGIYFQFVDWGWREPRLGANALDLTQRIPSEFDKRSAAHKQALAARDVVMAHVQPAQTSLNDAQFRFPSNHLFYNAELARLRGEPKPIEIREVLFKDGQLALDTPGRNTGRPVFGEKVAGLDKSYAGYRADLKKVNAEINAMVKEVRKATEATREITFRLNGKDDAGKEVQSGLYTLLESEKKAQDLWRSEKDYLQPIWARTLEEAELLTERRARLQRTLDRIQGKK